MLTPVLEAQVTEQIGASPSERSEARHASRHGDRPRPRTPRVRPLVLPGLQGRDGSFRPPLGAREQRSAPAWVVARMARALNGVSTRNGPLARRSWVSPAGPGRPCLNWVWHGRRGGRRGRSAGAAATRSRGAAGTLGACQSGALMLDERPGPAASQAGTRRGARAPGALAGGQRVRRDVDRGLYEPEAAWLTGGRGARVGRAGGVGASRPAVLPGRPLAAVPGAWGAYCAGASATRPLRAQRAAGVRRRGQAWRRAWRRCGQA